MKMIIGAALLGVLTASASAAADATGNPAKFDPLTTGEGGDGSGSVRLSSNLPSTFLVVPDAAQSLLVTVGEGGEGGEGRRGRRLRRHPGDYYGYYRSPRYRYDRDYSPYYMPDRYGRPYYDQRYYRRPSPYY
ncbi:hypothetical protein [Bradyrhizobium sp. sGM-13]|uniref:hypothetical protein n=1 Tax=Bradyrhizobium sp. sGM-13 TaxID=2831781 RepID=UPI001BCF8D79|nr:hypothetical protein [Bradyrhizobium sp. sGM-13]